VPGLEKAKARDIPGPSPLPRTVAYLVTWIEVAVFLPSFSS
jgi:hypothetical protein